MGKITAAFFATPNDPNLESEHIGFRDVLNFCHTTISKKLKQGEFNVIRRAKTLPCREKRAWLVCNLTITNYGQSFKKSKRILFVKTNLVQSGVK